MHVQHMAIKADVKQMFIGEPKRDSKMHRYFIRKSSTTPRHSPTAMSDPDVAVPSS